MFNCSFPKGATGGSNDDLNCVEQTEDFSMMSEGMSSHANRKLERRLDSNNNFGSYYTQATDSQVLSTGPISR